MSENSILMRLHILGPWKRDSCHSAQEFCVQIKLNSTFPFRFFCRESGNFLRVVVDVVVAAANVVKKTC